MIKTETVEFNGTKFVHTYSDEGYTIMQDENGGEYYDAIDPIDNVRTYTETQNKIETPQEPEQETNNNEVSNED